VNSCAGQQAENDELAAHPVVEPVDQHIDADVDAGTHAVGGTELGHPDEHDDGQFLGPAHVDRQQPVLQPGNARTGEIAMDDGDENDQRRDAHEEGDQPFLKVVKKFHEWHSSAMADRQNDKAFLGEKPPAR
jgi:hypothetical protein